MKELITIFSFLLGAQVLFAQQKEVLFDHILITNDDGIENVDILFALAKNVKELTKRVSVITSTYDRSGSSNYLAFGKHKSSYEITTEYYDSTENIAIYTIPGYPADCVLLGLSGLFANDKPDLILSGINGGSNIGPSWFGSGTIGAVRTAALLGVKGIAFSGFDDDDEKAFTVIPEWIAKFLTSEIIQKIDENSYLTVSFPDGNLEEIKGSKISNRRISYTEPDMIQFKKIHGGKLEKEENKTVWVFSSTGNPNSGTTEEDILYLEQGFIVITPMTINENNEDLFKELKKLESTIPKF